MTPQVLYVGYEPNEEISVFFPDLDVATSGTNDDDALVSARELLGITLAGLEEDGEEIPEPTPLHDVSVGENERTVLIDVYMPAIRLANVNKSVNRTVTLPAWLNAAPWSAGLTSLRCFKKHSRHRLQLSDPPRSAAFPPVDFQAGERDGVAKRLCPEKPLPAMPTA